jgi:hypothetical protein
VRKERESSAGEAEEAGGGGDDGGEVGRIFSYICFCLGGLVVFVPWVTRSVYSGGAGVDGSGIGTAKIQGGQGSVGNVRFR